ncbi:MAG: ATP-binding protein, partial [Candidatus Marinimicrobia bacterium]|nr:ATP-binding protein [Candidatus Neomarinimicrobiota bacterium]
MNSLQRLLQLGLTLSLMLLMGMLWWAGSWAVQALGEDLIGSRLEHDAESLLAAIVFKDTAPPQIQSEQINPIYKRPFSGHYYI